MKAIIYHSWQQHDDTEKPYQNLRIPLVLSIATLRAHNNYTTVYVLDGSDTDRDWGVFPNLLNFKVIKWDLGLRQYSHLPGWNYLARLMDVYKFAQNAPEEEFIYCDSDVFWFRDPLPLTCDSNKFCFDLFNSGFYYFNKTFQDVDKFFELFNAYSVLCLNDEKIREEVKSIVKWQYWYFVLDEVVCYYICDKFPELYHRIPYYEHGLLRNIRAKNVSVHDLKMLHCNGLLVGNSHAKIEGEQLHSRGLMCLYAKEFYQAITKSLGIKYLKEIFQPVELEHCLPRQFLLKSDEFVNALPGGVEDVQLDEVLDKL